MVSVADVLIDKTLIITKENMAICHDFSLIFYCYRLRNFFGLGVYGYHFDSFPMLGMGHMSRLHKRMLTPGFLAAY